VDDVPKSRSRKKSDYVAPIKKQKGVSALGGRWGVPTMLTLLIVGLAWVVLYYVASGSIGFIDDLGAWNVAIGFGFMFAGLMVATRWN
jgi:Cell division protein CrgA